jgi:lysophospholipase L1-like esterase
MEYQMKRMLAQLFAPALALVALSASAQSPMWTGSWAASPMAAPEADAKVAGVKVSADGTTFRNLIHLSIGGKAIRIRLSNEYGPKPLTVGEVDVATSAGQGAVTGGHAVTFGGSTSVDIPAGTIAISDPVPMPVAAFADLAVSVFVPAQPDIALTYHQAAISTNYTATGNQAAQPSLQNPAHVTDWYLLTGIDVDAGPKATAVVVLGASVVNGTHSSDDKNLRWPDDLARRLASSPATAKIAVLNEGIGGNRILHDRTGLGGLARVARDVISQTNASILIFSMGTNDIGNSAFPKDKTEKPVTFEQMKWATLQVVTRAHARGMRVICATLNPYEGANYYNASGDSIRQAFNEFVRSGHGCDGTVDFDLATLDPSHPARFLPKFDSGDHLHPNDAGYQAMADAIDLKAFSR